MHLSFKKIQMYEKYQKGEARGRHWKNLKQIIETENYQTYHADEPNCEFLYNAPSICSHRNLRS